MIQPSHQRWHSQDTGAGSPSMLWLHGWGHDLQAFKRIADLFNGIGRHRVFDLPGFGKTPMLFEGASSMDYAEALAKQLDSDGEPHIIVGHSYGSRVAIQFAARYPEMVKAIILISGAGLPRRRSIFFKARAFALKMMGRAARLLDRLFKTQFRQAYITRFGSADYKAAGPLRATLVSAVTENLSSQAKQVKCPVLLIYGSADMETPIEVGLRYEQLIPIARFVELKGYDHHDILARGAYQCEAQIKSFLRDIENG